MNLNSNPRHAAPVRLSLRRAILGGLVGFLLWKGGAVIYDAYFKTEEDHVRDVLQSGVDGATERSPRQVSRVLSDDFKGPQGLNKSEIHQGLVQLLMQEFKAVEVRLEPQPVPVQLDPADKTKASATFKMHAKGKTADGGEWVGIAEHYDGSKNVSLKATFRKTDEGWRVTSVTVADENHAKR
mgnify:CR=1 FL=1